MDGEIVERGSVVWSPANLQDGQIYYWRVRVTDDLDVRNPDLRTYSTWSESGYFYTDFQNRGFDQPAPQAGEGDLFGIREKLATHLPRVFLQSPANGVVVPDKEVFMRVAIPPVWDERLEIIFELDTDPSYRGDFFQGSLDRPVFFEIYYEDLKYTGDGKDDDLDGRVDEEYWNQKDDDGDGVVDEDTHHPLQGKKWPILAFGAGFGLFFYTILGFFGMPIFFVWGYIRSVASAGVAGFFTLFTEIIGALLAKYYFWPRYGKQEWRRYAMVLAVGFGVGMSLIGMFSAALLMISKAVSATKF